MLFQAAVYGGGAGALSASLPWRLQCVRHRVSISSFKQWKDLLVFKRHDGHHVWNLPQLKPNEYGFRRIARKPPFFKVRKLSHPKVTKTYSFSHPFNRTLQIEYNWHAYADLYHEFHEAMQQRLPGVSLNAVAKSGDATLKVATEDGQVIFDAATDRYKDARDVVEHCCSNILRH